MLKIGKNTILVQPSEELTNSLYLCAFGCAPSEMESKYSSLFSKHSIERIGAHFDFFIRYFDETSNTLVFNIVCDNIHVIRMYENKIGYKVVQITNHEFELFKYNHKFTSKYHSQHFDIAAGQDMLYYEGMNIKMFVESVPLC